MARGRSVSQKSHERTTAKIKHQTLTKRALLIRFILHMSLISPWECASRLQPSSQPSMLLNACTRNRFIRFVSHINKHSYFSSFHSRFANENVISSEWHGVRRRVETWWCETGEVLRSSWLVRTQRHRIDSIRQLIKRFIMTHKS